MPWSAPAARAAGEHAIGEHPGDHDHLDTRVCPVPDTKFAPQADVVNWQSKSRLSIGPPAPRSGV
jgi:hypothetical protein